MHVFIIVKAALFTEIFELSILPNRSKEPLLPTDVLLAVAADLQPLLVVLQAHIGAELLDV